MQNRTQSKPELAEARQNGFFDIGEASKISGISTKMIRHYEQIDLIPAANQTYGNYRIYNKAAVHILSFIKRARVLGFSMKKTAALLNLYHDKSRTSAEVKRLAQEHIAELEDTLLRLQEISALLKKLVHACHGDHLPECPILEGLSAENRNPS